MPVSFEVPISKAGAALRGSNTIQHQMTTTGAGTAVVLACLTTAGLGINAGFLWHLYAAERQRAERPLPRAAALGAYAYILGIHTLPWLAYVAMNQVSMRRGRFQIVMEQDARMWALLVFFCLEVGLHVAACSAAAAAFAQGARALRRAVGGCLGVGAVNVQDPSRSGRAAGWVGHG